MVEKKLPIMSQIQTKDGIFDHMIDWWLSIEQCLLKPVSQLHEIQE